MATPIPKNRARFTVEQIAAATAGAVVRPGGPSIGVSTDSRALDQGAAFVALVGDAGALVRDGTAIFPHGDDVLEAGDRVIVFTEATHVAAVERAL